MDDNAKQIYARQGFGNRLGLGTSPALVVIDFVNGFADPDVLGGGNIPSAIKQTEPLLSDMRSKGLPIAFTRHVYADDGSDHGLFNLKLPTNNRLTEDGLLGNVVETLKPRSGELVLNKRYPSAFFGTHFATWLTTHRIDTLIVTGCVTSGCIRASVVDAMCLGFRPMVIEECVGDRAIGPHQANLFDIQQKYGDVISKQQLYDDLADIGL
ncbi:MAG: N-carbamoylsarcosine amidohydrolase [Pseudomonadota bacterium]